MPLSALVTGGTGFVGRHLVSALREAGWRVATLDRHAPADHVGDLGTMPLRALRADVVFHLAGFSNPAASIEAAAEAYAANATATSRLVREVRAGRFVLASTCQVYPYSPRPVTESATPRPGSPYAASKLCGEALALASGRDVVILRPFNHTGPGQVADYICPFIARQVARAEAGGSRTVSVKNRSPRLDLFDVRDMARAYLAAAERGRRGTVYNVGTGRPVSIGDILDVLVSLSRVPLRVQARRGPETVLSGDSSLFRSHTGWRPRLPLRRTLSDLLTHERMLK